MGFTDEEWESVTQEMPGAKDAVIQQYLNGREKLIAEEHKKRSDYAFRQALSPIARKACEIVDRIRNEERKTIWTTSLEEKIATGDGGPEVGRDDGAGMTLYPGQVFTHAKGVMERTKLYQIVRQLPKGSLLHAHCDAIVNYDFLFGVLLETPGMHIAGTNGPLSTPEQLAENLCSFPYRKQARHLVTEEESKASGGTKKANLAPWDPNYVKGTPVLLTEAADAFPDGGREGFIAWLKSRCTISQLDSIEQHHGVDHIWVKFFGCFGMLGAMIHYEPVWRRFLRQLMRQMYDDGVMWVEVRMKWVLDYRREGSEEPETDYLHLYGVADEEIKRFREETDNKFWGLRFIWTELRAFSTRPIAESMDHCITTKLAYPHLIAGFDLVGQEDLGRPLKDVLPELFWFRQQCAAEGVNIPFFFHAGECLGDGDDTDNNVFDAVLLGTRRIGHGFSLYKHPLVIDMVKEKKILIESCPISNEVLRLCGSILSHPLPALIARGVPCGLSNDDPAILGQDTEGLTHDFWQALQGWENLGLAGLGSLAENSVRWSAFEDETNEEWMQHIKEASLGTSIKAQHLKDWSIRWEKFCLWVVTEYGEKYGDE
ncbi:adenosine deaminase family protein [Ophiostoma piceae UAMH 11346]|uniref:adenosine deaminase n=1 Tax=Ophiostoma piceae (strain UAMH 11346) TaxID=1262450 RepID=S3D9P6_OPHP1|nr:adenosine deaminase family protein [Ophiostoma piceae UAMH 11346]